MIEIQSAVLRAAINPLGAELCSLVDSGGRQLMTDADPSYWKGYAPLLFPVVGALKGGSYRLRDGREFAIARHGFARHSLFAVIASAQDQVVLRLADSEVTRAQWPFAFRLDIHFRVDGPCLGTRVTVSNEGTSDMPFSFGFHPAFAWPLPFGGPKAAHRVSFCREEPGPVYRADGDGLLLAAPEASPVEGQFLAPTAAMFEEGAVIWQSPASRSLVWGVHGAPCLRVDFPDMPMLALWQKPEANFLCVEPWAGIADPAGYEGVFEDKPGIMMLRPGEERLFRMDVTLLIP